VLLDQLVKHAALRRFLTFEPGNNGSEIADAIVDGLVMFNTRTRDVFGAYSKRSRNHKWLVFPLNRVAFMALLYGVFPIASHAKRNLPGVLTDTSFAFERFGRALMSPSGKFHSKKNYALAGDSTLVHCRYWTREE
jgi:hypothetical protein